MNDCDLQDNRALCKAAPRKFPFSDHRNMHEVMLAEYQRRERTLRFLTFPQWCEVTYG